MRANSTIATSLPFIDKPYRSLPVAGVPQSDVFYEPIDLTKMSRRRVIVKQQKPQGGGMQAAMKEVRVSQYYFYPPLGDKVVLIRALLLKSSSPCAISREPLVFSKKICLFTSRLPTLNRVIEHFTKTSPLWGPVSTFI